jgi:hypothetical protein
VHSWHRRLGADGLVVLVVQHAGGPSALGVRPLPTRVSQAELWGSVQDLWFSILRPSPMGTLVCAIERRLGGQHAKH